ncbi:hydroxyacid dehydrogenase [Candidatus Pacearchaeota archaeon]|nr:hydroxyacid dehydrogenase [Candidatus Pacearchaeota archaeon]
MKVSFFELKGWEQEILKNGLRKHKLNFDSEPLTEKNISKVKDADVISVFVYSEIDKKIFDKMKKIKLIITRSAGFDHIDLKECKRRKIVVLNIPRYGENTVAEHTFALILALSRKVHESHLRRLNHDFSIEGLKGFDLAGKTLGVIGTGRIGKHVIRIARGFEMNVLAHTHNPDDFLAEQMDFKYVGLNELLKKSDIITIHVPYCEENFHLIDKNKISMMKKGVILINTARGELVDTESLIEGLETGKVGGAGLDVLEGEKFLREEKEFLYKPEKRKELQQIVENHELLSFDNVVYTPHIAFYSQEALVRIIETTVQYILDFGKGKVDEGAKVCM